MASLHHTRALERLVQLLVDGADEDVLDRILLDAVRSLDVAGCLGLWRVDARGVLGQGLTHGDPARLPDREGLRRHLEGAQRLEGDARVVHASMGVAGDESAIVLVLADLLEPGAVESAGTLLEICARRGCTGESDVDGPPAALPATSPDASERRLAHDMRNHLAGLRTVCDVLHTLEQELEDDERDHFGSVLTRECRRAGELLASVLEPEPSTGCAGSELVETLHDVLASEEAAYERAHAELELRLEPAVHQATSGMPSVDFSRVLRNLLVNVREACATPAGPAVQVLVELQVEKSGRGGLVLSVEDDGPGIAPDLRERLFQEGTSTKTGEASGFGLATVRSLVEAAGGEVRVQHLPLRGTRFQVWIPEHAPA